MRNKEYTMPTMLVVKLQHRSHLLAGSLQSVSSIGLGSENPLQYDGSGGDQRTAW